MVFVTIGNQDFQFTRLLNAVESAVKENFINEEVVVQSGYTIFQSSFMKVVPFLSKEDFEHHIIQSSYIISHAGTGSIINGLRHNKKLIVAARLKKFSEHIDDHQVEILEAFSFKKHIIPINLDISDLNSLITNLDQYEIKPFISNSDNFNKQLSSIINKI